ncbi:MAG: CoA transferase [Actinomycetes bacterium]
MTSVNHDALAPLEGLRIIDVSTYVAGPSGAMTMAQMGADVIRVDPIGGAPDVRRLPLAPQGQSLFWAGLNKGKRSIEVDLSSGEGRALVQALIAQPGPESGFVLTNSVGAKWLDYDELRKQREDVIKVFIRGRSDGKAAVDYTINAEVGLPWLTGPIESGRPVNHVLPAWDLMTGVYAATAVLAAERVRNRTGRGQNIDISLASVAVATMANLGYIADVEINNTKRVRDGNFLYGGFGIDYQCEDDVRIMVVALTPRHWRSLIELTGVAEAVDRLQESLGVDFAIDGDRFTHRRVLNDLIRPWFQSRSGDDAIAALDAAGVLWGRYRTVTDMVEQLDSLMHTSGILHAIDQPGIGTYSVPGPVLDFSGWDAGEPKPAPLLGQHTDEVLGSVLGLDAHELSDLRDRSVIGGPTI